MSEGKPWFFRGIAESRREAGEDHDDGCRHRTGHFLQSKLVEYTIIVLTVVDLGCVLLEMGIERNMFCISPHPLDAHSLTQLTGEHLTVDTHLETAAHRRLSAEEAVVAHQTRLSTESEEPHAITGETHHICEHKDGHHTEHISHTAHMISIGILTFFVVELLLKMACHPVEFFHNWVHVLELVVVSISLAIDLFMSSNHELTEAANVLVVVRFWRVARVLHGCFAEYMYTHEHTEKMHEQIEGLLAVCEEQGIKVPAELAEMPEGPWLTFHERTGHVLVSKDSDEGEP